MFPYFEVLTMWRRTGVLIVGERGWPRPRSALSVSTLRLRSQAEERTGAAQLTAETIPMFSFPFRTMSGFAVYSRVFCWPISEQREWLRTSTLRTCAGLSCSPTSAIGYDRSRVALGRSNSCRLQKTPAFKWVTVSQWREARLSMQLKLSLLRFW